MFLQVLPNRDAGALSVVRLPPVTVSGAMHTLTALPYTEMPHINPPPCLTGDQPGQTPPQVKEDFRPSTGKSGHRTATGRRENPSGRPYTGPNPDRGRTGQEIPMSGKAIP